MSFPAENCKATERFLCLTMRRGRPAEFGESVCMWDPAPGDTQMVVLVNPLPHCFYWMKFCQISFIKCGNDSQAFLVASALTTGPKEGKKPTTVGDMILQSGDCCQLGAFCWLIYVYFLSPRSQLLTQHYCLAWPVYFSFNLSIYINRPSKPATST